MLDRDPTKAAIAEIDWTFGKEPKLVVVGTEQDFAINGLHGWPFELNDFQTSEVFLDLGSLGS